MTQDVRLRLSVVGQAQVVNALDSASASLDAVAGGGKRVVDALRPAGATLEVVGGGARSVTDALDALSGKLGSAAAAAPALQQALSHIAKGEAAAAAGAETAAQAMQRLSAAGSSTSAEAARFIDGLERQAAAIGKTRAEILSMQAAQLGVADKARPLIQRLTETEGAANGTGRAIGLLTPQVGDLVSQIASGGAPLTAFLQQGLQLRDVFSQDEVALQGLKALINPTTVGLGLLAVAAGGAAAAAVIGYREHQALTDALTLTGNTAGVTAARFDAMADRIADSTSATVGDARELLQAAIDAAAFGQRSLEPMAEAMARVQSLNGQSAEKIVGDFAKMRDGVAKWAAEHNRQYSFLTLEQYRYIRTLEEQGHAEEAMAATGKALNDALRQREPQLGTLQQAWERAGKAASEAWKAMKGWGVEDTTAEQIAQLEKNLAFLEGKKNPTATTALRAAAIREQIDALREVQQLEERSIDRRAQEAAANQQAIAQEREREKGRDRLRAATEREAEAQARLIAQMGGLSPGFSEEWERLSKIYARGGQSVEWLTAAQATLLAQQPAIRDAAKVEAEQRDELNKLLGKQQDEEAKTLVQLAEKLTKQREHNEEIGLEGTALAAVRYARAQANIALLEEQAAMAEVSGAAPERLKYLADEIKLKRQIAEAEYMGASSQANADAAKASAGEWIRAFDQVGQSLSDALMRGGKGAGKQLVRYFETLTVRMAVQALIVNPAQSALGLGRSGVGGGAGATGYVNTASSAYNLYGAGSTLYAVGAQYAAGTMSAANAAGTLYANATAAAYGDGLTALLATNGAYGTAAGASGAAAGTAAAAEGASAAGAAGGGSSMGAFASAGPYAIAALVIANALGLFRTTKQVGGGIMGTVGDTTDIQAYDLMRKSGTLFSGPDYSYSTHAADPALVQAISAGVGSVLASTRVQAGAIGVGSNIASFTGTLGTDVIHPDTGGTGIKLDGLTGEQAQQKVAEAIGALAEKAAAQALGPAGEALARSGETAAQTLARLSGGITTANDVLHALGSTALQASVEGAAAAQRLIDAFGGTEALASAAGAYYDAIYSDSEKLSLAQQHLQESFSALGQAVPENAAALKTLADAQDRSTESGTAVWAGLVKLGPAYAEVQRAIEEQAAKSKEAAAAERERAQAVAAGLAARSRADTPASLLIAAQQAAAEFSDTITKMLDVARDQGSAAYATAQEAARAMGQAQAGWMLAGKPLAGMAMEMEKIAANAEAMRPALIALYGGTYQPDKIIAKGIAQQTAALKSGFMSDVTDQLLQLTDSAGYAAAQLKKTQQQRLADAEALGLTGDALAKVLKLNEAETAAQRAQQLANAWGSVGDTISDEIARLRGLAGDGSTQSVTALQAQFITATAAARAGDAGAAGQLTSLSQALEAAARGGAGNAVDYARMRAWIANSLADTLAAAGVTPGSSAPADVGADTLPELQNVWKRLISVPAFAAGGLHSGGLRLVGERGPELEVTGPARYFSAEQTRSLMSGGGADVVAELRELRREVGELRRSQDELRAEQRLQAAALVRHARRSADVLELVAEDGEALAVRVVADGSTA